MNKFSNIGQLIKESRINVGLSQKILGQLIFNGENATVNGQFISNIERELCGLPYNKITTVSRVLQIDQDELIEAILMDEAEKIHSEIKRVEDENQKEL